MFVIQGADTAEPKPPREVTPPPGASDYTDEPVVPSQPGSPDAPDFRQIHPQHSGAPGPDVSTVMPANEPAHDAAQGTGARIDLPDLYTQEAKGSVESEAPAFSGDKGGGRGSNASGESQGNKTMMLARVEGGASKPSDAGPAKASSPGDFDWDNLDMGDELAENNGENAPPGGGHFPLQAGQEGGVETRDIDYDEQPSITPQPGSFYGTNQHDLDADYPSYEASEMEDVEGLEVDMGAEESQAHYSELVQQDQVMTELNIGADAQTYLDSPISEHQGYSRTPYRRKPQGGVLKGLAVLFFTLVVLVGLGVGVVILGSSLGYLKSDVVSGLREKVLAALPIALSEQIDEKIYVLEEQGKWLRTRNGHIFLVSGTIVNTSDYVINFVEVQSEYVSGGERMFSHIAYAGNTFTDTELRTLTIEEIDERLSRRNGDIDFKNTDKLAGLNYGIMPDETVPFYTMFPSESKILGLRYRVGVSGFEKGPLIRGD